MAKPILVVGIPVSQILPSNRLKILRTAASEMNERYSDYYVLLYPSFTLEDPLFQVFYEKDMIDIDFENLKNIIENNMKKYENEVVTTKMT